MAAHLKIWKNVVLTFPQKWCIFDIQLITVTCSKFLKKIKKVDHVF